VYVIDLFAAGRGGAGALMAGLKYALQDVTKPKIMHAHGRVRLVGWLQGGRGSAGCPSRQPPRGEPCMLVSLQVTATYLVL
jgi:hypothetical protein